MYKIFSAMIAHETHGFNRYPSTIDNFKNEELYLGDKIKDLAVGDSGWNGIYEIAREQGWELIHPVSAVAMPSGPATKETFEYLWSLAEDSMHNDGPFDGVIWQMHGGQMCEHLDDPEAEIIRRTRSILGKKL